MVLMLCVSTVRPVPDFSMVMDEDDKALVPIEERGIYFPKYSCSSLLVTSILSHFQVDSTRQAPSGDQLVLSLARV